MELAPIVLFTYNRPDHTRKTLEALTSNYLADKSILFIYADGPKADATEEMQQRIRETRQMIREKQWCKEVHIVESDYNRGLADSVIKGVTEVCLQFGKVIVLEDDIVASKGFLQYMNEALELYRDEERIIGVSGYTYPNSCPNPPESYFLQMGCSWGWATWHRAWSKFNPDSTALVSQVKRSKKFERFDVGNYPFFEMLLKQERGEINSWAIRFYASLFLADGLFLFPGRSLCANIGFDNSGTHCSDESFFSSVDTKAVTIRLQKQELNESRKMREYVGKSFSQQFVKQSTDISFYIRIKRLVQRLNLKVY